MSRVIRSRWRGHVPNRYQSEPLERRLLLATVTVTNNFDNINGNTASIAALIGANGGDGISLREAVTAANNTTNSGGPDVINFQIPGTGVHTITYSSIMPSIIDPVTIDATTESDYAGLPRVELDGVINHQNGLLIQTTASGSTVRGLAITRFAHSGILILSSNNVVEACHLGVNAAGTLARGNVNAGVYFLEQGPMSGNRVGGTTAAQRNVISANLSGVVLDGANVSGTLIQGNYIGTDATGTLDLGNTQHGVFVSTSANNTIGGTAAGARNIISGNNGAGVRLVGAAATGNTVAGNYIGTDVNGTADLGNTLSGVEIDAAPNNTVGGTVAGARNVIGGNDQDGVRIINGAPNSITVAGNYIGLAANGNTPRQNTGRGVWVLAGTGHTIGSTTAGGGNVISGNFLSGVEFTTSATGTVVGNLIGTDATGTLDRGNGDNGVQLISSGNTIGGTTASARNVISGNDQRGVLVVSNSNNVIQGNYIGTDITGNAALGNAISGVQLNDFSNNNVIGGTTAGARNVISGNLGQGIFLTGSSSTGNQIQGNYIGTNAAGTATVTGAAANIGVRLESPNVTVGGSAPGARNVISGHATIGVHLAAGSNGAQILGNYIGTNAAGDAALSVGGTGIYAVAAGAIIGGSAPGAGNVISGHVSGITVEASGSTAIVRGNRIGTNAAGTAALANSIGITSLGAAFEVGGTAPGQGNVISGNSRYGIRTFALSFVNVDGNWIGTAADGVSPLGNGVHGIRAEGESGVTLGSLSGGANVIAYNGGSGVVLLGSAQVFASFNSIHSNVLLGIDYGADGVTPGGTTISSAVVSNGHTIIKGTYNGLAGAEVVLHFYHSAAVDASGHGEGETPLYYLEGGTNSSGNMSFSIDLPQAIPIGNFVSATASSAGTSEFSQSVQVVEIPSFSVTDVTVTEGHFGTVNATFTVNRSGNLSVASTVLYSTSNGSAVTPADYEPVPFTQLSFAPGDASKTVTVLVNGDTADELNETFNVNLSSPNNATIGDAQGVGTIVDDDLAGGSAELQSDPSNPSLQALVIVGTIEEDDISLEPAAGGQVRVIINGVDKGTFGPTGKVYAYGLASDDVISVNTALPMGIVYEGSTGGDALHLNAGSFTFDADAAAGTPGGLTLHVASGASALFNASQHLAGLVLSSGGTATLSAGGNKVLAARSISITGAGSRLDLTDNDLIVDYTGGDTPAAAVEALVAAGFNGGEWNGDGIVSSAALADPNFMLAVAENATLLLPFGDGVGEDPLFAGQVVDDTTVLVKFTHRVDLDLDGLITGNDAAVFNAFFSEAQPTTWQFGDLDLDGLFTGNDAAIFNGFYNEALPQV